VELDGAHEVRLRGLQPAREEVDLTKQQRRQRLPLDGSCLVGDGQQLLREGGDRLASFDAVQ
jgi:hypothetical protein